MQNVVLEMNNIHKRFHGVYALKGVHFDLRAGEVHALMGENGAGKSTLMKVLCGIYERNEGDVVLFDKPVNFSTIKESQDAGISMIHQELNMMNHLTVAQNIYIGREPMINGVYIDDRKMEQDAAELFKKIRVNIDPSASVRLRLENSRWLKLQKRFPEMLKYLFWMSPLRHLPNQRLKNSLK